jgi:hypothetical protein
MGHSTVEKEIEGGRISLVGQELFARTLTKWLRRSSFADVAKAAPETAAGRPLQS